MLGVDDSTSSPHLCRWRSYCYFGGLNAPLPSFLLELVNSYGFFLPALKAAHHSYLTTAKQCWCLCSSRDIQWRIRCASCTGAQLKSIRSSS